MKKFAFIFIFGVLLNANAIASGGHFDDCIQRYNAYIDSAQAIMDGKMVWNEYWHIWEKKTLDLDGLARNLILGWYYQAYMSIDRKCYEIDYVLAETLAENAKEHAREAYAKLVKLGGFRLCGRNKYGLLYKFSHGFQAIEYKKKGLWVSDYHITRGYANYQEANYENANGFYIPKSLDNSTYWVKNEDWRLEYRYLYLQKNERGVIQKLNVPNDWYFTTLFISNGPHTINENGDIYIPIYNEW